MRYSEEVHNKLEQTLNTILQSFSSMIKRAYEFINSQRMGIEIFANLPSIITEAVWQYSHRVLAGIASQFYR
jgi:hypothetical protein